MLVQCKIWWLLCGKFRVVDQQLILIKVRPLFLVTKKMLFITPKKIINLFLEQEKINPADYQICVLDSLGAENFNQEDEVSFGKSIGKSIGSAVFLALLSAYHQQPISRAVAAT